MAIFNRHIAAQALVDATLLGDREAAQKHKVCTRTVERWRSRIDSDPELSALVQELRQLQDRQWAQEIPETLAKSIQFIKTASQEANPKDPNAIAAIVQAIETLSDVALTWKMLDERIKAMRS